MNRFVCYENLTVIVVTYDPDINLMALIGACRKLSHQVIVVDNNSKYREYLNEILSDNNISVIQNRSNYGIGKAINLALQNVDFSATKWVLTFDQDSFPPPDLLHAYNYVLQREKNVGLIGVNFYQTDNSYRGNGYHYANTLDQITSGLLHNVDVFNSIGIYNEKMFIDCVDFEYTLRANAHGYKTIMIQNCFLHHTLGTPKIVKCGKFEIQSMNHSAFRQYFIVRNHIWLAKKYMRTYPKYMLSKFYHLLIRILKTLLIDDDKRHKLIQISRGVVDGIRFTMD